MSVDRIAAPLHDNFRNNSLRYKFNKSLEECCRLHANTSTLFLKQVWDPKNSCLFLGQSQRFTAEGYRCYWEAVDRTVRYFNSVVLKKQLDLKKSKKAFNNYIMPRSATSDQKGHRDQKDRFRWQNPMYNRNHELEDWEFHCLPPPLPPRKF